MISVEEMLLIYLFLILLFLTFQDAYVNFVKFLFKKVQEEIDSRHKFESCESIIKNSLILTPNRFENDKEIVCGNFHKNCIEYLMSGMESIIQDEVLTNFEEPKMKTWNLLTRNRLISMNFNLKLRLYWILGIIFRYFILLPLRVISMLLIVLWLITLTPIILHLSDKIIEKKKLLVRAFIFVAVKLVVTSFGARFRFHEKENKPSRGVCVANHTTVFDTAFCLIDNYYSITGQKQNGFMKIFTDACELIPSIFIERSKADERSGLLSK